jgi:hypothetical protein
MHEVAETHETEESVLLVEADPRFMLGTTDHSTPDETARCDVRVFASYALEPLQPASISVMAPVATTASLRTIGIYITGAWHTVRRGPTGAARSVLYEHHIAESVHHPPPKLHVADW